MRTLALAAWFLAAAAAARAQSLPGALVWVPPEDFKAWSAVASILQARSDLKLTVALTPAMATPLVKAALGPWAAAGRVEFASRIPGDPVLPLVAAHPAAPRPDDALERAAAALRSFELRLGTAAAGLVPGSGVLDASLVRPLGAAGAAWILAGTYAVDDSSWAAAGRTVFVPARLAAAETIAELDEASASGAIVVDESAEAEARFPQALSALPDRKRPLLGWATVSELLSAKGPAGADAAAVASWPGWNGAAAEQDSSARDAWSAYGEAAAALARYQNSGAADLRVLEGAVRLLRRAQDSRFFRALPPGGSGLTEELRARLLEVYKKVKSPAPDSLYAAGASTAAASELPTGIRSSSAPDWVAFDNPAGTLAKVPAGALNADPWRLRGLRVEWNAERVVFRLFASRVDAQAAAPRPVYDVYIDLNRTIGAGRIRLLDGRGSFAQARDAWEFAVSVVGLDARLWRAGTGDEPDEIGAFKAEADPARGEVRVSIPRDMLRGSPSRWGYIVLALADDDMSRTLGLIAPLELQASALDRPGVPVRVSAVRLEAAGP